jgi:hypothetical protein
MGVEGGIEASQASQLSDDVGRMGVQGDIEASQAGCEVVQVVSEGLCASCEKT